MSYVLGKDCKLYVLDNGNWQEVKSVREIQIDENPVTADGTTRGSGRYRQKVPVLMELTLQIQMLYDPADNWQKKLLDAASQQTVVKLRAAEGDITTNGKRYLEFDAILTNKSEGEPLEDLRNVSLQAEPAAGYPAPQWSVS